MVRTDDVSGEAGARRSAAGTRIEAAVFVPFHRDDAGRLGIVLIERSARGRHGGQIALPGGRREPGDRSLRATAVRETSEELGIPEATIVPILDLEPVATRTSGFLVAPVVGRLLAVPVQWRPQEQEVAAVLDVPVDHLVDRSIAGEEIMQFAGWPRPRSVPVLRLDGHLIWGLTLRILEPLLPRALAGELGV
jgi:8-oxo-dGTP pyrophosphatase MutT (NUDIX family)